MNLKTVLLIGIAAILDFSSVQAQDSQFSKTGNFDIEKDLLLLQCDFKTDVDDLQTVAGFATILQNSRFKKINYHAVAGTYGIQDGLYVPPNPLLELAFGDHWTDAHEDLDEAVAKVKAIVKTTLLSNGDVWISEAGQSDFTARIIKAVQADMPDISTSQRIHVVQHAEWNEEVTSPELLDFVRKNADYHKIPDGNGEGNGTPGFRDPDFTQWKSNISDPKLMAVWQLAINISNAYNGKDGRYYNEAIAAGGLDFSDLSEVCWIFGIHGEIKDIQDFFDRFSTP